MEKTLAELTKLQDQINLEKNKYKEAIKNHQKFEDVKLIYLKIKDLQKAADILMQKANQLYNG
jgi:hypothetical protein